MSRLCWFGQIRRNCPQEKEEKVENEDGWDGKVLERAKKEEEKAKVQYVARVGIVEDHILQRTAREAQVRERVWQKGPDKKYGGTMARS